MRHDSKVCTCRFLSKVGSKINEERKIATPQSMLELKVVKNHFVSVLVKPTYREKIARFSRIAGSSEIWTLPQNLLHLEAQGTWSRNPGCEVFEEGASAGQALRRKMMYFNYLPGRSNT